MKCRVKKLIYLSTLQSFHCLGELKGEWSSCSVPMEILKIIVKHSYSPKKNIKGCLQIIPKMKLYLNGPGCVWEDAPISGVVQHWKNRVSLNSFADNFLKTNHFTKFKYLKKQVSIREVEKAFYWSGLKNIPDACS